MDRWDTLEKQLHQSCPALDLRREEPLFRHTSFRVGGPAALMALPASREEAAAAVRIAAELGVIPVYLGNGSNLLVSDEGYDGFLIKTFGGLNDISVDGAAMTADSGVLLSRLAAAALEAGLTGLEFAHGIPGTLGGAVTMNAGAYGGEMVQVLASVTFLDEAGRVETLPVSDCGLGYRRSMFSDGKRLILGAELALAPGDPAAIRARMEELGEKRRSRQPLELPSAGSTFKRPEGHFAAALIEQCGCKGLRVGGAQVSEKHAGFVVNTGGATCRDILALIEQVRARVLEQTGVALELEVKTLGIGKGGAGWNLS